MMLVRTKFSCDTGRYILSSRDFVPQPHSVYRNGVTPAGRSALLCPIVPGDGQGLTFQELMGLKRAAYYLYTSDKIDAQTTREIGLVNEVLPLDRLVPRAWEIAEKIMKKPRSVRRLTSAVLRRPWKRRLVQDLGFGLAHELLGLRLDKSV